MCAHELCRGLHLGAVLGNHIGTLEQFFVISKVARRPVRRFPFR